MRGGNGREMIEKGEKGLRERKKLTISSSCNPIPAKVRQIVTTPIRLDDQGVGVS
jgi:hypothetical protein